MVLTSQKVTKKRAFSRRQTAFLAAYSTRLHITRAAHDAKVSRRAHYRWMSDDTYREAFYDAKREGLYRLEAEVRRRAVDGIPRKMFHNGEPIIDPTTGLQAIEIHYSDRLLLELLRRHSPEWRPRLNYTGPPFSEGSEKLDVKTTVAEMLNDPDFLEYKQQQSLKAIGQ